MWFVFIVNGLSMSRLLSAPLLAMLLLQNPPFWLSSFWVFTASALTDFFDGWLAREFGGQTHFGAILDPLADKCLGLTLLCILYVHGALPGSLLLAMLLRDTMIIGGGIFLRSVNVPFVIKPFLIGKAHTFVQFVFIFLCLGYGACFSKLPPLDVLWMQGFVALLWVTTTLSAFFYGQWGGQLWMTSLKGA